MKLKIFIIVLVFVGLYSCKTNQIIHASTPRNEMFKVSILYENGKDNSFNMDYYENTHMPMVAGFLGDNLKFYEIDKGVAGRTSDEKAPFVAIGIFYVEDIETYNKAIGQNIEAIISDIKNYTNIQPVIQISEVTLVSSDTSK